MPETRNSFIWWRMVQYLHFCISKSMSIVSESKNALKKHSIYLFHGLRGLISSFTEHISVERHFSLSLVWIRVEISSKMQCKIAKLGSEQQFWNDIPVLCYINISRNDKKKPNTSKMPMHSMSEIAIGPCPVHTLCNFG